MTDQEKMPYIVNYWKIIGQFETTKEQISFVIDNPIAISSPCLKVIMTPMAIQHLGRIFEDILPYFGYKLKSLPNGMVQILTNPDRYPTGDGPIEKIWQALETKEITLDRALSITREKKIYSLINYDYIKALINSCYQLMVKGNLRKAIFQHQVINEITKDITLDNSILNDDQIWKIKYESCWHWIEIASFYLIKIPDGRIFHDALNRGIALISEASKRKDNKTEALLNERVGVLHLDPYNVNKDITNDIIYKEWSDKLQDEVGKNIADKVQKEFPMPNRSSTLKTAKKHLEQAIALWSNEEDSFVSHVALTECMFVSYRLYNSSIIIEKVYTQGAKTLEILRQYNNNPEKVLKIKNIVEYIEALLEKEVKVDLSAITRLLEDDLEQVFNYLGWQQFSSAILFACNLSLNNKPILGLELIEKAQLVLIKNERRGESTIGRIWISSLSLLIAYYLEFEIGEKHELEGLPTTVTNIHLKAIKLLKKALNSSDNNNEEKGLEYLEKSIKIFPELVIKYHNAIDFLSIALMSNTGVNYFNKLETLKGIQFYSKCLLIFLRRKNDIQSLAHLKYLQDGIDRNDEPTQKFILQFLSKYAVVIENEIGKQSKQILYYIYRASIYKILKKHSSTISTPIEDVFQLIRLAKGHLFAANLIQSKSRDYKWSDDAEALKKLAYINDAFAIIDKKELAGDISNLELALFKPLTDRIVYEGHSDRERFENLKVAFDQYITQQQLRVMLKTQESPQALHITISDIQNKLSDTEILLDFFSFEMREGQAIVIISITKDESKIFNSYFPNDIAHAFGKVEGSSLSQYVFHLRKALQEVTKSFANITDKALDLLKIGELIIEPIISYLDEQKNNFGKNHLYILPHGELHYMPFHLLAYFDKSNWSMSYLPNIFMLFREAKVVNKELQQMAAIGIDFSQFNHYNLSEIELATKSATTVAQLFDEQALLNDDATESKILTKLENSKFAYIITHGMQCIHAPSFHCVFCSPSTSNDGIINSYEVLELNLESLEILALSACETGLGRFDLSDNLTGLPASFLQKGVGTIIATLWEVNIDVADYFYTLFFKEIKNKSAPLEAFKIAQNQARSAYPIYADWGSFIFIGNR